MIERGRIAADALWPSALFWLGVLICTFVFGADQPPTHYLWRLVIISALAAEYFLLKAATIIVRWQGWHPLSATLILTNSMLAFAFFLQFVSLLWPEWALRHIEQINYVGYLLIIGFIVGIAEIALIPKPVPIIPPLAPLDTEEGG